MITKEQLKETNLIFAEHQKLLNENELLCNQLNNYKEYNSLLVTQDSLRQEQYQTMTVLYDNQINDLNSQIKKKNSNLLLWKIGGVTVSVSLLLFLLLK